MPGCISACSCVASPTPPDPKAPPKPKWIELKGYCVTCTSQEDIRPPKAGEPKQKNDTQRVSAVTRSFKRPGGNTTSLARPDSKIH